MKDFYDLFDNVSKEEWAKRLLKDLKGEDPYSKLLWETLEGISVSAWSHKDDSSDYLDHPGDAPYRRGNKHTDNNWNIAEVFTTADSDVKSKMLSALAGGVNHLIIKIQNEVDFSDLFKDIQLDIIHTDVWIKTNRQEKELFEYLDSNYELKELNFNILYDPISENLRCGIETTDEEFNNIKETVRKSLQYPFIGNINVQGNIVGESGGNAVQELAYALAVAYEYLHKIKELGNIDALSKVFRINLSVGRDFFMELSKIRAMRLLWSTLINAHKSREQCNLSIFITAKANPFYFASEDPYNNMLRGTVAVFAAACGGADSIICTPEDADIEVSTKRTFTNIQHILQNESYVNLVSDPFGGAYLVENLTDELVKKAWKLFQEIEHSGGILSVLKSGSFQNEVFATRDKKINLFREGKLVLVGVNKYISKPQSESKSTIQDAQKATPIISLSPKQLSSYLKTEHA